MPADDLYWSPIDFDSEESNNFYRSYIDPWDLENYAYIRQHLDSTELSSGSSNLGEQLESTSTFTYLPGDARYGSVMNSERTISNYAAIDEIDVRDQRDYMANMATDRTSHHDMPYRNRNPNEVDNFRNDRRKENSMYIQETKRRLHKIALPSDKPRRTRSYSYSDGYEPINPPQQIYSKLEDVRNVKDTSSPIYDDIRIYPRPTTKFGLSRYGHLKIDYSYSWNNLNKYICN